MTDEAKTKPHLIAELQEIRHKYKLLKAHTKKIEQHISSIWKVVGILCFMFTIVFAETVKSFIDIITL